MLKDEASQGLDAVEQKAEGTASVFQTLEQNWVAITAAGAVLGGGLIKVTEYSSGLNDMIRAVAIGTDISEESLRKLTMSMSDHTLTNEDVARTMDKLNQVGYGTMEHFEALIPVFDNFADATGKDIVVGVEIFEKVLGALNIPLDETAEHVDALTYIITQTNIPLETFQRNLGRVPDELQSLEFGLEESAAGVQYFIDKGYSAEEAVREFRRAVEASGGDLEEFYNITGMNADIMEDYSEEIRNAEGLTDRLAESNNRSIGIWGKLKARIDDAMWATGTFLEPVKDLGPLMMGLGPAIKGVSAAKGMLSAVSLTSASSVWALVTAKLALLAPIALVVAAIAAAVAIAWYLYNNWDEVVEFITNLWQRFSEWFSELWEGIREFLSEWWSSFSAFWIEAWNELRDWFVDMWNGIKNFFVALWEFLFEFITSWWDMYWSFWFSAWEMLRSWFIAMWESIRNFFETLWNAIYDFLQNWWNTFLAYWTNAWETMRDWFVALWESIKQFFETLWNAIYTFINKWWDKYWNFWTTSWEMLRSTFFKLLESVRDFFQGIWNGIQRFFETLWNNLVNNFTNSLDRLKTKWDNIWNGIKDTFKRIWDGIGSIFKGSWNALMSGLERGINFAIRGINGFISTVNRAIDTLNRVPGVNLSSVSRLSEISIPRLAKGGDILEAGLAMVGESGPEILQLPVGARVKPLPSQAGEFGEPNFNFERMFEGAEIHIRDEEDIKELAREIYNLIKRRARGEGVIV